MTILQYFLAIISGVSKVTFGCPQAISLHGKPERLKDDRRHGNEILLALAYSVTKSHALITINCVQKQNFKTS